MPQKTVALLTPSLRFVLAMWGVFAVEHYLALDLGYLGIYPRSLSGLFGVVTAPFIHGNWTHLISNTFPFMFLSGMLYIFYPKVANRTLLQCHFFTGLLVWLFGREFYHIGASGVVYGIAAFLIALGFLVKDFKTLAISIVVLLLYGGLLYGVLPTPLLISYESHLFGAVVGVSVAVATAKFNPKLLK